MNANPTTHRTKPSDHSPGWPTLTGSHEQCATHPPDAAGHLLAGDHLSHDPQHTVVSGDFLADSHTYPDTHTARVVSDPLAGDNDATESKGLHVSGDLPRDTDQRSSDAHVAAVGVASPSNQPPTKPYAATKVVPSDGWLELRIWAEQFNDAQQARIAATNRAERGGVDPIVYQAYTEALTAAEKVCGLHMRRCFRRVVPAPIVAWQKQTLGLGEHLLARLLGHLGHPIHATPHHWEGTGAARTLIADEPHERTIAQLWQYCGHGAPGRPKKGATFEELAALGSPTLKMIVHLCAEACMKTRTSPYRYVYEKEREAVNEKTHTAECVRCGPSGKPAQPDSPWSAGHQHAHALRIVGKEILRDLWIVAGGSQRHRETHSRSAAFGDQL